MAGVEQNLSCRIDRDLSIVINDNALRRIDVDIASPVFVGIASSNRQAGTHRNVVGAGVRQHNVAAIVVDNRLIDSDRTGSRDSDIVVGRIECGGGITDCDSVRTVDRSDNDTAGIGEIDVAVFGQGRDRTDCRFQRRVCRAAVADTVVGKELCCCGSDVRVRVTRVDDLARD